MRRNYYNNKYYYIKISNYILTLIILDTNNREAFAVALNACIMHCSNVLSKISSLDGARCCNTHDLAWSRRPKQTLLMLVFWLYVSALVTVINAFKDNLTVIRWQLTWLISVECLKHMDKMWVWMSKNIETTDTFLYLKIPKKIYKGRA